MTASMDRVYGVYVVLGELVYSHLIIIMGFYRKSKKEKNTTHTHTYAKRNSFV